MTSFEVVVELTFTVEGDGDSKAIIDLRQAASIHIEPEDQFAYGVATRAGELGFVLYRRRSLPGFIPHQGSKKRARGAIAFTKSNPRSRRGYFHFQKQAFKAAPREQEPGRIIAEQGGDKFFVPFPRRFVDLTGRLIGSLAELFDVPPEAGVVPTGQNIPDHAQLLEIYEELRSMGIPAKEAMAAALAKMEGT